jgi:hypothetical protein
MTVETYTPETFEPLVDELFHVDAGDAGHLDLRLERVDRLAGRSSRLEREPFVLHFRGDGGVVLPQRIYRFEHAALGEFEIFIVPVGRDVRGTLYEAIFT